MPWTGRHDIELVVVSRDDGGKAIYYDFETGEVQSEEWVAAMANRLEKHAKNEPVKSSHNRQRKVLGIFYFHMCGDLVYLVHPLLVAERTRTANSDSFHSDVTLRFEDAPYIKDAVAYFKSKSPILCYECHGLTFVAGCQVCLNACIICVNNLLATKIDHSLVASLARLYSASCATAMRSVRMSAPKVHQRLKGLKRGDLNHQFRVF
jgi:hypothetical protein